MSFPETSLTPRSYEKSLAIGDENNATEHLRQFFEQHFHEAHDSYVAASTVRVGRSAHRGSGRGLRQHALLNVARRHYLYHEYVACRKVYESVYPLLVASPHPLLRLYRRLLVWPERVVTSSRYNRA